MHIAPTASQRTACPLCPGRSKGLCEHLLVDQINGLPGVDPKVRSFAAGSELYTQGMPCRHYFIVTEGWVALSATLENGARQILDFVLPGGLIGLQSRDNVIMAHSAECLTAVSVAMIPQQDFHFIIKNNNALMDHVLHISSCHEARAYDHIQNISRRHARSRIAHLLVELFFRLSQRFPSMQGESIELPLTLTHIADALGLTHVHVSRTLRELRQDGVLRVHRRRLHVMDPSALMALSGYNHQIGNDCEMRDS